MKNSDNSMADMIGKMISRGYVVRIGGGSGNRIHASAITMRTDQENRFAEGSGVREAVEVLYGKIFQGKK